MAPERKKRLLRAGIPLLLTIVAAVTAVSGLNALNKNKIADNMQQEELNAIGGILPDGIDGDIFSHQFTIPGNGLLSPAETLTVFRIMRNNEQTGIVLLPVSTKGYNGPVELAIGIMKDGSITGVTVIKHQETKGLGGDISDPDSGWIAHFTGRSLANTPNEAWAVHGEGGDFDQLSGATITSRTVINAVNKALHYYDENQKILYRQ